MDARWLVTALNAIGLIFMLLGLAALALPTAHEGIQVWQVDNRHAVYAMDVAGGFALALGLILTWLGSRVWHRMVLS